MPTFNTMVPKAVVLALSLSGLVLGQKPPLSNYKCVSGDCQSGEGVQEHPSGFKYQGEFEGGARTGRGEETMPGGVRFAGEFKDNAPNGFGVMLFPDGRHFAGEWKNEFPHGCGLSVEVTQPDRDAAEMKMHLRHVGRWEEGEIVDPEAECHVEVNKAHEIARAIITKNGGEYSFEPEGPRRALTREEVIDQMETMQQNVLQLISLVTRKAADEEMDDVEKLSEALHSMEITFVKMYYAKKHLLQEGDFQPLFSRDSLETVIFETMLEIDESTVDDTSQMEEQLALMETDLEEFPTEDEQNLHMLNLHIKLTTEAIENHKAQGEDDAVAEATKHLEELRAQASSVQETIDKAGNTPDDQGQKEL